MPLWSNSVEFATIGRMNHHDARPILLLGVQGQVGWELRRSLRPLGRVVCTARHAAEGVLPLDLADADRLRAVVREVGPSVIVNAAAYALVDQAEREPELCAAVNAVAPGILQEEANRVGAAVVHYSTDYVFDGSGSRPWTESDPVAPLGVYGSTKAAGEQAVLAAGGASLVLRTSWVYGIHGVNFVKKILKLAEEREKLRIVADQIGAPTSARYLADLTAALLAQTRGRAQETFRERGGLVHATCRGATSWHGFTLAIVEAARRAGMKLAATTIEPIASSEFPTPAKRPLNSRLDGSRLQREFGLVAPTWEEALADTLPTLLRYEFGVTAG
jgi:dTDP-4-dehydrorhamnose reductase